VGADGTYDSTAKTLLSEISEGWKFPHKKTPLISQGRFFITYYSISTTEQEQL